MAIFEKTFWKISKNSRLVTEFFDDFLTKENFTVSRFFSGRENHIVYKRGDVEFDFWWERGNRPVLFLRKSNESAPTDIYSKLMSKHRGASKDSIGQNTYYLFEKLDIDSYFDEHVSFVKEYLKNT
ncbi:hypothetical protein BH10BAC1_BH10BAC1_02260 [soil metagenome]